MPKNQTRLEWEVKATEGQCKSMTFATEVSIGEPRYKILNENEKFGWNQTFKMDLEKPRKGQGESKIKYVLFKYVCNRPTFYPSFLCHCCLSTTRRIQPMHNDLHMHDGQNIGF